MHVLGPREEDGREQPVRQPQQRAPLELPGAARAQREAPPGEEGAREERILPAAEDLPVEPGAVLQHVVHEVPPVQVRLREQPVLPAAERRVGRRACSLGVRNHLDPPPPHRREQAV